MTVLDKRIGFGGYNATQDYNLVSKNLNNKKKMLSSRSSGKLSKKTAIKHPTYLDKYGNRVDIRFSAASSSSKKRTSSFKRMKENEFRKLLRPMQTNVSTDVEYPNRNIRNHRYTIENLIDGSFLNNSQFKTLENVTFSKDSNENQSKSDTKIAPKRINKIFLRDCSPNESILQEHNLNSVKCNLWTNEDLSVGNLSIDDKTDYSDLNDVNLKSLRSLKYQNYSNILTPKIHSVSTRYDRTHNVSDYKLKIIPNKTSNNIQHPEMTKTLPLVQEEAEVQKVSDSKMIKGDNRFELYEDEKDSNNLTHPTGNFDEKLLTQNTQIFDQESLSNDRKTPEL